MLFSDINVAQDLKNRLIQAVKKGRVPHAQLFLGQGGRGGLSLALAYAQYISCENPGENDACGKCDSCKKYNHLAHPDLHFVFPVVKTPKNSKPFSIDFIEQWKKFVQSTNFHTLEDWLKFLGYENAQPQIYVHEAENIIKTLNYKAFSAKYKIMIIWLPEKMNIAAANKLLKIIEEPPENTIFLLVSHDDQNILPTIKSRTQIIKLPPLSVEGIKAELKKYFPETDEQIIDQAAKSAGGDFIIARNFLLDSLGENNTYFDLFVKFMREAYAAKPINMLDLSEELHKLDKEKQKQFLHYSLHLLRQAFILNLNIKQITYLSEKELNFVKKFSAFVNKKNIDYFNFEFSKAINDLERNANPRLVFSDLLFTSSKLLKIK